MPIAENIFIRITLIVKIGYLLRLAKIIQQMNVYKHLENKLLFSIRNKTITPLIQ